MAISFRPVTEPTRVVKFRPLTAEEIEVRVSRVNSYGAELLLYKDSRVDMRMLDETVGPENWRCSYYECKGTLFCSVGILLSRGDGVTEWVNKDNAGAPSNTEAEKGEASDAFKRACFSWGIGRELYTAPRIFVPKEKCNVKQGKNGKLQCYDRFRVAKVEIIDGRITGVRVVNDSAGGSVAFSWADKSRREG